MAARVPDFDIFSQGLVTREDGGWKITTKGRLVLEFVEARPPATPGPAGEASARASRASAPARTLPSLLGSSRSEEGCQIQAVARRGDAGEQQSQA